jgi:death-on-curing protein
MSQVWKHLTAEAVKAIQAEVLAAHGGGEGLRDQGLLESAVAAPQATWSGEPIMTDPREIAAAYLFYLCRNHPFVDGNKRVALATCLTFLAQNEVWAVEKLPVDEWEAFVLDVAASRLDRDQTTQRLKTLMTALEKPGRKKAEEGTKKRRG